MSHGWILWDSSASFGYVVGGLFHFDPDYDMVQVFTANGKSGMWLLSDYAKLLNSDRHDPVSKYLFLLRIQVG